MPRHKNPVGSYNRGTIIEYEVHDTTHWVQMARDIMVRCDDDARFKEWGLVKEFSSVNGLSTSYVGRLPPYTDEKNWIEEELTNFYTMEKDVS
jgi:hypothetical protein